VFGLLVGFYTSPKLTGILLLVGPIIIGITAFLSKVSVTFIIDCPCRALGRRKSVSVDFPIATDAGRKRTWILQFVVYVASHLCTL